MSDEETLRQAFDRYMNATGADKTWAGPVVESEVICFDPTAPETVAALADALPGGGADPGIPLHLDRDEGRAAAARMVVAAAILPAFVARLRGETS